MALVAADEANPCAIEPLAAELLEILVLDAPEATSRDGGRLGSLGYRLRRGRAVGLKALMLLDVRKGQDES